MSIPKADKGLAEFVKTLDPSMYTISGGAPQPNAVANEVKALKEQQEYQWYQDQAQQTISIDEITADSRPAQPSKIYDGSIAQRQRDSLIADGTLYMTIQSTQRNRREDAESNPFITLLFGIGIGIACVLVIQKCF